ncbi:unnamed protein product, partial [Ixodes pacificus]
IHVKCYRSHLQHISRLRAPDHRKPVSYWEPWTCHLCVHACVRVYVCYVSMPPPSPPSPAGTRGEASYFRLFSAPYRFCTKQSKAPVSVCDLSVDSFIRKN